MGVFTPTTGTQIAPLRGSTAITDPDDSARPAYPAPVLEPRPGGLAERFAAMLSGRRPALVFFAALLLGFVIAAAASIAVGAIVNHLLLPSWGIRGADESVNDWLARNRSAGLTDASAAGSFTGGAPLLPIIAALLAAAFAMKRWWRLVAFAVFALAVESALYRVTTLLVHATARVPGSRTCRPTRATRPVTPPPSIAVYSGLALLLTSRHTSRPLARARLGRSPSLMPVFVALSRMYRGMHHPIDVAGGVVSGSARSSSSCSPAAAARRRAAAAAPGTRRTRSRRVRERWRDARSRSSPTRARRSAAGFPSCAACSGRAGSTTRSGTRCRRAKQGAERVRARARRRGRARLRVGRRRHGAAQHRRARRRGREARDHPGRHREPVRDQSRHPAGHRAGGRHRPRGDAPALDVGPLQRRALRRHGGRRLRRRDDPRRERAQGPRRARRLPVERLARTCAPSLQGPDRGRRRRLVRGPGDLRPRRQRRRHLRRRAGLSRTPSPTTARSSSASSPPRARSQWMRTIARTAVGRAAALAVRPRHPREEDRRRARPQGPATSSTAAIAARSRSSRCAWSPRRSRSACRPMGAAHDCRGDGGRSPRARRARRASASRTATRSSGSRAPDSSRAG